MNERAMMAAIKDELVAQTWTGSSNVVFPSNGVAIVADIPASIRQCLETKRVPACLIASMAVDSDPEHDEEPDWMRGNVDIAILTMVGGDAIGEFAMIDGARSGGTTVSQGAGILRYQQEVFNAVGKLNALEAITLQFRQKAEQGAAYDQAIGNWVAWRVLRFEGWWSAT